MKLKVSNKIDWKFGNSSLACEKSVQKSDNSRKTVVLASGSRCFQAFVSSARREKGEEDVSGPRLCWLLS